MNFLSCSSFSSYQHISLFILSSSIGNCLILDGYDTVQESSTDEEAASSFLLQPVAGLPSMDSAYQEQYSPQSAHSDGAGSPFIPEFLLQRRWGAMEDSCFEIQTPSSCADSQSQIMEYIHKIEADLEHLKVPYTCTSIVLNHKKQI